MGGFPDQLVQLGYGFADPGPQCLIAILVLATIGQGAVDALEGPLGPLQGAIETAIVHFLLLRHLVPRGQAGRGVDDAMRTAQRAPDACDDSIGWRRPRLWSLDAADPTQTCERYPRFGHGRCGGRK